MTFIFHCFPDSPHASLFHVVVGTDETASKVLDIMIKEKSGRVTFMPLNRLKPKPPSMPVNASDAEPLLNKLDYDSKYEKAFQQVFGKMCVCRDLTIAASYVKSHGINTITLDGDRVDRKGSLTGGYHDVRRSRIEAVKSVGVWRGKWEEAARSSKAVKDEIGKLEQEITQLNGSMVSVNGKMGQVRDGRERLMEEGASLSRSKERVKERITALEVEVEDMGSELSAVEMKLEALKLEMGQPLVDGLTPQEEALIGSLGKEVEKRRKEMVDLSRKRNEVRILVPM